MPNMIEYATKLTKELDKKLIYGTSSAWMEKNAVLAEWMGAKIIRVPSLSTTGLGDYKRADGTGSGGYPKSTVNTASEPFTLKMDRGSEFEWDRLDYDESGYILTSANTANEFQNTWVIPEIDSYRYSTLSTLAIDNGNSREETITIDNVLSSIVADFGTISDKVNIEDGLIVTVPRTTYNLLANNKLIKASMPMQVNGVNVDIETITYEGNVIPIQVAQSKRMKTSYLYLPENGYTDDPSAKNINYLITGMKAPIAVKKLQSIKAITPDENMGRDSYELKYRILHDVVVKQSQMDTVFASIAPSA